MFSKTEFNRICKNIKFLKIQGARNVALAGLKAYKLNPTETAKKKIISLRATEPFLINALKNADKITLKDLKAKIKRNQEIINREVLRLIKRGDIIFTHCHSSTVVKALIYAKKRKKRFEVYLTETRPLYQGRKTARELKKAGIKVTMFIDSAASVALEKESKKDKIYADLVLFGADAITEKGVINKVGSGMFAQIAKDNKISVYILADSMKYIKKINLEERNPQEIWDFKGIHISNFAFELIEKKYIKAIISEFGKLSYSNFLRKVRKLQ